MLATAFVVIGYVQAGDYSAILPSGTFLTGGNYRFTAGLVTPTVLESGPKAPNAPIRIDNHSGFPGAVEVTAFCGRNMRERREHGRNMQRRYRFLIIIKDCICWNLSRA